ncbi:metal-dependent hydrolase [Salibacterium aidingense]|uniref:metal-dependent hydrolase n=1 Tax=Salibacterium aidingense TaxID=384933 RepID=UPI0004265D0D|nr:metal-dependent hydrolase [Salibacterium aidingense]
MNAGTHTIGALAAGAAVYTIQPMPFGLTSMEGVVYAAAVVTGGLLPDICQPFSWIGRRMTVISKVVQKLFGHRTITHSLLFLCILYIVTGAIPYGWGPAFQYGLTIGMASHFILDMMTPRGIRLLYPVKYNVMFPLTTKTGSVLGEGTISVLMLSWIVYFSIHII